MKTPYATLADSRRVRVSELYLAGKSQSEIGQMLSVEFPNPRNKPWSQQTISVDIRAIRTQWRSSAMRNFDEAVALELARLDHIEHEALDAWQRSIGKSKTVTKHAESAADGSGAKKYVTEKLEKLAGDPRFLAIVQDCIKKRCELLGLNAPVKMQHAMTDIESMNDSELEKAVLNMTLQLKGLPVNGNGNGNGHSVN